MACGLSFGNFGYISPKDRITAVILVFELETGKLEILCKSWLTFQRLTETVCYKMPPKEKSFPLSILSLPVV